MGKSRIQKIAIVLLMTGAVLAGMAGMTCAINDIGTSYPPGVQPLATGGTVAGGVPGTPYATGGPSRCVGILCTADWIGTSAPQIGGGVGAGGSFSAPPGISSGGPAGSAMQGYRDYTEWASRCAGIVGPGDDPLCYIGSPGSLYTTGWQATATGTLPVTGRTQIGGTGQSTGGTPGTLPYQ